MNQKELAKKHGLVGPDGETFALELHVESTDRKQRTFKGIAAAFGTIIESWIPTKIRKGAFSQQVKADPNRCKVLRQHNPELVMGKLLKWWESDRGLEVEGMISETTLGSDTLILMEDEVLDEMSIGINIEEYLWEEESEEVGGQPMRTILKAEVPEVSIVVFPRNKPSRIEEVNAALGPERGKAYMEAFGDEVEEVNADVQQIQKDEGVVERYGKAVGNLTEAFAVLTKFIEQMSPEERNEVGKIPEFRLSMEAEHEGEEEGEGSKEEVSEEVEGVDLGEIDALLADASLDQAEADLASIGSEGEE